MLKPFSIGLSGFFKSLFWRYCGRKRGIPDWSLPLVQQSLPNLVRLQSNAYSTNRPFPEGNLQKQFDRWQKSEKPYCCLQTTWFYTQVHWWFEQWAFIFSEGFLYKRHPHAGTYLVLKKVTQPTLSVHLSVIMKLCCLLTTYVDVFFLIPVKLFLEISLREWMICNIRISLLPDKIGECLLDKRKASVRHMNHNFKKIGTKNKVEY